MNKERSKRETLGEGEVKEQGKIDDKRKRDNQEQNEGYRGNKKDPRKAAASMVWSC